MILVDFQIKEAIQSGEIIMENFSEHCLQPASYDMRIGEEGFTSDSKQVTNIKEKGMLLLKRGDFGVVSTYESIELPPNFTARIGMRSFFSRRGLVATTGPQIDPGYRGKLFIGLINLSPSDIALTFRQEFCTIEIHKLAEPASNPYKGPYQDQLELTDKEIDPLIQQEGLSFPQLFTVLETLSRDVGKLADRVNMLIWVLPAITALGLIFIGIIVGLK